MIGGKVLTKTIGAVALGLTTYDIFSATKRGNTRYMKQRQLQRVEDVYLRTDSLDSNSKVASNLQNWARNWYLGNNFFYKAIDGVCGFTSNLFKGICDNIINIGLGLTALFAKGKFAWGGKIAAAILALQAGKFIFHDLFGWFADDPKKMDF